MKILSSSRKRFLSLYMKKLMVLILPALFISCSKSDDIEGSQVRKYQAYVDHYSKDMKTLGSRTLWYQAYLEKDQAYGMDTITNKLQLNCITDSMEHIYYKINDKMMFPTLAPELKPARIDTNFTNYSGR